jgi:hypothetical protein
MVLSTRDIIAAAALAELHLNRYESLPAAVHLGQIRESLATITRLAIRASNSSTVVNP